MPKILLRTHAAMEDCEKHLQASGAGGTEIEAYLTQYLVVILCADIQQEIYRLSEERAALISDAGISSFISVTSRKLLRSIKKGEIVGYVAMFGTDCKDKLNSQLPIQKYRYITMPLAIATTLPTNKVLRFHLVI
jgi:hypothetical protein